MSDTYMFEAEVFRFGTDEKLDTIHAMAYNLFQATHIFMDFVHDKDSGYSGLVELGQVKKLTGIRKIVNPYFALDMEMDDDEGEYDENSPYTSVENLPDSDPRIMIFSCSCKEQIRVHKGDWEFIRCKNCENKIYRSEVEEFGGKYVYVKKT